MPIRTSNSVGFTVIETSSIVRTGIMVEVLDGATGAELAVLEDTFDRTWTDEHNGTGAGSLSVLSTHRKLVDNPSLLGYGNLLRFSLDGTARFVFQIDQRVTSEIPGASASIITVSGRGALALLEDIALYPVGGIAGPLVRTFSGSAGDALVTAITEGQARGAAQIVGLGFSGATDSRNAAWLIPLDIEERAGQTDVLRLAQKIGEVAADVWMDPSLTLQAYNQRGLDRSLQTPDTGPVQLREGENITNVEHSQDMTVKNALVVTTGTGLVERIDAPSITSYRRREATLSLGDVTDPSQITRHAEAVFRRTGAPADRTVYHLTESNVPGGGLGGRTPYVDFGIADTIMAPDAQGALVPQVVYAITVQESETGGISYLVELSSLAADFETRLGRWLAALNRGTLSGLASRVAESSSQTVTQTEATADAAADAAIAEHVGTFLHPDELSDLADVNLAGAQNGDFLKLNGVWVPSSIDLNALDDVDTTSAVNGDVLQRVAGVWKQGPVIAPKLVRRGLTGTQSLADSSTVNVDVSQSMISESGASAFLSYNATTDQIDVTRGCLVSISGSVQFASNGTGQRRVGVTVNGSSIGGQWVPASTGADTVVSFTTQYPVSGGDTIALTAYQSSGGPLDMLDTPRTFLSITIQRDDG